MRHAPSPCRSAVRRYRPSTGTWLGWSGSVSAPERRLRPLLLLSLRLLQQLLSLCLSAVVVARVPVPHDAFKGDFRLFTLHCVVSPPFFLLLLGGHLHDVIVAEVPADVLGDVAN